MAQPTLLVANRGEIALRVFRTARRMGMRCVAVHSDADAGAPFVRAADTALRIGPAPATESYLNIEAILEAARSTGAELIHPGYGFLAEDARFAQACADAGLTFVGPPPGVLRAMGDKAAGKLIAEAAGVGVLSGYAGEDQSDETFVREAELIGYPVLVKPAAGGGGKGMAVVRDPGDLASALASARRIASAAFGSDRLLLERYLDRPRHIEVQVIADTHGGVLHLGERDCSLQRRHQKVLEESPAPSLDDDLRARICDAAVALAREVAYRNAGTCEFLLGEDGVFGFIEMNARLQVEHPVTEMVTGLDLVELQLRVAMGEPLPVTQSDVHFSGHAIEVRVYAEDPGQGFLPQAGAVHHVAWGHGIRVDTGVEEGSAVPSHYDPMVAKLIVHAPDRTAALWEISRALEATEILGVRTNLPFLQAVVRDPIVADGKVTTTWLEEAYGDWRMRDPDAPPPAEVLSVAAAAEAERLLAVNTGSDPWARLGPWRASGPGPTLVVLRSGGEELLVRVEGQGPFAVGGFDVSRAPDCHAWTVAGRRAAAAADGDRWLVWWDGMPWEVGAGPAARRAEDAGIAHLGAPLPGQVTAVRVDAGQRVARGQELVVIEAMKMEHAVKAPTNGTITAVLCSPGAQVDRDQPLVELEPEESGPTSRPSSS